MKKPKKKQAIKPTSVSTAAATLTHEATQSVATIVPSGQPRDKVAIALSLLAILISIVSSWVLYHQAQKFNHAYVKPDIIIKVRHDTLPRWTNVPFVAEVVILNRGPIKAASVYVDCKMSVWETNYWWPYTGGTVLQPLNTNYSFVIPELDIGDGRIQTLLSAGPMAVYEVTASYFRPNDMEKFVSKELYFYMDGVFYSESEFKHKECYPFIMKNMENAKHHRKFEPPPGKSMPPTDYPLPPWNFNGIDDNEAPRPIKQSDFYKVD